MQRYNFKTNPVARPDAIIGGTDKFRFTVLTDGLIRLEWAEDCNFENRASVLAINRHFPLPDFRVVETEQTLQVSTSRFSLTYDKKPFSASGLYAAIKGSLGLHSRIWRYGEEELNLGGTARTLDGSNGRIPLEPGIVSRAGFAEIDDSTSMLFDSRNWISTRRPGKRIDIYLFAFGHEYREAIKVFYTLSGSQPLLPRWALGNWWSRYHAYSADSYLALLDGLRSKDVPFSVAVLDMDWHLVGDDPIVKKAGVSGWTGYTWNRRLFPDPSDFIAKVHSRGLRVSLNDHPADGVYSYEEPYEDMAKALHHDTSNCDPIQFDITNQEFLDAFFDVLHRRFEDQGIDFWWTDWQQGSYSRIPGVDPLWVLNHFHFLDSKHGGKRPMAFSRYAGPGCHRYPIGFSGDTVVTWESLNFQPEFTATASNIGFGHWSHDIGGHMKGYKDDEMLIRWIQLGVFSPILRLHSSNSPWSLKEPWSLPNQYETIMIDYLRLRHRLVPYLYTMNVVASEQGLPLIQPMYWGYPERDEAYEKPNQYLFGSELMIAPITSPEDTKSRRAQVVTWFPPGRYVDILTGTVYDGDRELTLTRRMADYPILAREGSIIPLDGADLPANGCSNPSKLEIYMVVGTDARFELIEDEESSQNTAEPILCRTPISFHQAAGEIVLGPASYASSSSLSREWLIRLIGCSSPGHIRLYVNGVEKPVLMEKTQIGLLLNIGTHRQTDRLVLKMDAKPQLDVADPAGPIELFLKDTQIELETKEKIQAIVEKRRPVGVKVGQLMSLDLDQVILQPMMEYLLADSRFTGICQAGVWSPSNGVF